MSDEQPQVEVPAPPAAPVRILTLEERNDLRRLVLSGYQMSLEEAKAVVDTARQGRGVAAMAAEAKPKKGRSKKAGMTDEALSASLDDKLKGL